MSQSVLVRPDAGWFLSLYPDAGEAGGAFVASVRPRREWAPPGSAADPVRSRVEAGRRAGAKVRRYCAANRLNRLGTLTYAVGCNDQRQLRTDVAAFFLTLRCELGGKAFPYVWVPEWHKSGHGLHVHFAVGQYVPRHLIEQAWGRGFVYIKLLSDLPVGSTSLNEARRAAGYLSKYVTKGFDDPGRARFTGGHRYEVAQGFQPTVVRLSTRSSDAVLSDAVEHMGYEPSQVWSSAEAELWAGTAGGVVRVELSGLSREVIAALVAASCESQDLPAKVADPTVVRRVGTLLRATATPQRGPVEGN